WLGMLLTVIHPLAAIAGCNKSTFQIALDVGHSPAAPGAISARGVTEYSFNLRLTGVIERTLMAHGSWLWQCFSYHEGWEKKEPFVPYGQSKFAGSQSVSFGSSRFRAATIFPAVEL